jgi:hypothetical protein
VNPSTYEAIRRLMDEASERHLALIHAHIFRVEPELFMGISYPPVRWWTRARWRITGYLSHFWDAICGRECGCG